MISYRHWSTRSIRTYTLACTHDLIFLIDVRGILARTRAAFVHTAKLLFVCVCVCIIRAHSRIRTVKQCIEMGTTKHIAKAKARACTLQIIILL